MNVGFAREKVNFLPKLEISLLAPNANHLCGNLEELIRKVHGLKDFEDSQPALAGCESIPCRTRPKVLIKEPDYVNATLKNPRNPLIRGHLLFLHINSPNLQTLK